MGIPSYLYVRQLSVTDCVKVYVIILTSWFLFRCENALMRLVEFGNCIKYFQTAEEIGATELKNHCSQLISLYWVLHIKDNQAMPYLYALLIPHAKFRLTYEI